MVSRGVPFRALLRSEWTKRRTLRSTWWCVAVYAVLVLALLCTGLLGTSIGLSQTEQFRVKAESVTGYRTLAAHFPSGLTDPTRVVGPTAQPPEALS